ncbi:MAG: LamG domain-containing protein [Sandaracinaceae bacterium]|nr:LamG domain-containing protein [Sandaracinaceae bacterium]
MAGSERGALAAILGIGLGACALITDPDAHLGTECGALELSGGSAITEPSEMHRLTTFTLEAWINPAERSDSRPWNIAALWRELGVAGSYGLFIDDAGHPALAVTCAATDPPTVTAHGGAPIGAGVWRHVAATFERGTTRVFLDGEPSEVMLACASPHPLNHGFQLAHHDPAGGTSFRGLLDEVRLSRTVRYAGTFTPARTFEPDGDTMLLFQFEEADRVRDGSVHALDATPVGSVALTRACRPR